MHGHIQSSIHSYRVRGEILIKKTKQKQLDEAQREREIEKERESE